MSGREAKFTSGEGTMPETLDGTQSAVHFLENHGLKFTAKWLGCEANPYWGDGGRRDKYQCVVTGKGRGRLTITFWQSIHNTYASKPPEPYDLFACVTKYDPEDFANFCSEYGYDKDSRTAHLQWLAVQKEWRRVEKFFTLEELEELRQIS
jgi:hypothetical protein